MAPTKMGRKARARVRYYIRKGFKIRHIAEIYHCSLNTIRSIKKNTQNDYLEEDDAYRMASRLVFLADDAESMIPVETREPEQYHYRVPAPAGEHFEIPFNEVENIIHFNTQPCILGGYPPAENDNGASMACSVSYPPPQHDAGICNTGRGENSRLRTVNKIVAPPLDSIYPNYEEQKSGKIKLEEMRQIFRKNIKSLNEGFKPPEKLPCWPCRVREKKCYMPSENHSACKECQKTKYNCRGARLRPPSWIINNAEQQLNYYRQASEAMIQKIGAASN